MPLRYGVAVASVAVALALKLLLDPLITEQSPFLMLAGAVMVGAWYGGLGPGLLATALGALVADYFFLSPHDSSWADSLHLFSQPGLHLPLILFGAQGLLISMLTEALRAARQRAEASMLETQRNQEDLRKSEERFRLLIEGVEDYAIFMLDPEGRIVSWNLGAQRVMGYDAQEVVGGHFSCFFPPEDVRSGRPDKELRVASEVGQFEDECRRVRKDGSRFWADVVVTALRDQSGELRGFAKIVRDITERKQAEEALRRNVNSLLALYEAGQVLASSLKRDEIGIRLLEITQRMSALEAAVIHLRDERGRLQEWHSVGTEGVLATVRDHSRVRSERREASEGGRLRSLELRWPGDSGEERSITGMLVPLRVRDRVIGVLEAYGPKALAEKESTETFVSLASQAASALENARLYEELAARERELEGLVAELQDLVGQILSAQEEERRRVAYEVHDSLTQMAVATQQRLEIFAEDYPPESAEGQEELEKLIELSQRTVDEARRVIAGLRPTALDDFGLASAARLQVEELNAEGYHASYEETLGQERLPFALETSLFRVTQEALTNIRKHAKTDRVHVALGRQEGGVRLEIRDWGRGLDPTVVQNRGGPGERVGLSSMRERVALLGGELEIRSAPGGGTSVVAQIPLSERTEEGNHAG